MTESRNVFDSFNATKAEEATDWVKASHPGADRPKTWLDKEDLHIGPRDELEDHVLSSKCPCNPEFDFGHNEVGVINDRVILHRNRKGEVLHVE